ncbi:hypothetical protein EC973_001639 [Apophysomyces ossiformis]|uniref:SH3 domain-containing protein n=1 Tax=Apophysomyces ossiformis TaxID=679940 RepID=A0A8H7EV51_9FUNG|nr:hypothetical protein EC973_001639 [Apophysomyces ossiformis]
MLWIHLSHASYVQLPSLQLEKLEQIGIAGSYGGISLYTDTRQLTQIPKTTASVISYSNQTLELLASTSVNGTINAACMMPKSSDLYVAGNFRQIGKTIVSNIARINIETNAISALSDGLDGPVNTLLCDADSQSVFVGGSFLAPLAPAPFYSDSLAYFGGSIAVWKNNSWIGVPWKGFNGPVNSIVKNRNTYVFGGLFDTTADGQMDYAPASQPIDLSAPAITPCRTLGSNFTISVQVVSAGNSDTGYKDPQSVVCSNSSNTTPWLLLDNVAGYWEASFVYTVTPSLIRLSNTHLDGRGTKQFSVIGMPSNVNLNLSYFDPISANTMTCSTNCTLSDDPSIAYQDFKVLDPKMHSGLRISISSWYGAGGGLNSVEIFQSEIFVHADNTANFPKCAKQQSRAVAKGSWKAGVQNGSFQRILTSSFSASQLKSSDASVDFIPYLPESGLYNVLLYTPNCVGSSNCNQRTQVDVTVYSSPNQSIRKTIDQNVSDKDKTDIIYSGYIDATSSTFQPHVLLTIAHNATKPSGNTVTLVAQAVQFVKISSEPNLSSLLQYDPIKPLNMSSSQSLPWGALNDNIPYLSVVNAMESSDGDIYIGGSFNSTPGVNTTYQNIVRYDQATRRLMPLAKAGLNGPVSSFLRVGSDLYVGGSFSGSVVPDKQGLNSIARYDVKSQTWNAIGNGVNGPVDALHYLDNSVLVSGKYSALLTASSRAANTSAGNSWWNTTSASWSTSAPYLSGTVCAAFSAKTSAKASADIFVGNVKSAQRFSSSGLSLIHSNTLLSPIPLHPTDVNDFTITAGAFWNDVNNGNASTTIVGGTFNLDNGIQNVALYQNGTWSGIGANWVGNVTAMVVSGNYLYIGGRFDMKAGNDSSLIIYNLQNRTFTEVPDLYTSDGSLGRVNIIRYNPADNVIVVGGNFTTAGSLSCNSICSLDTSASQWNNLGDGIAGEVLDFAFTDNKLIAAGNLQLNGATVPIVQYDYQRNDWSTFAPTVSPSGLPGPSRAVSYDSTTKKTFIAGQTETSAYLRVWDGQQFSAPGGLPNQELGPGSFIQQIAVLPTKNTSQTNLAGDNSSVLLVTGFLNLGEYGNLSAALYDGSRYLPYLVSSIGDGSAGNLTSVFFKSYAINIHRTNYLPTPIVVLISIASSLAIVFAMVLAALGVVFLKRKRDAGVDPSANIAAYYGKPPRRPQSLIAMLNSAGANGVLYETKADYPINEAVIADRSLGDMKEDKLGYHEMRETTPAIGAAAAVAMAGADIGKERSLHTSPFATRPDSFTRPDSEIHGRDDTFKPAMRNSYNPFRQSTVGLAISSDYPINQASMTASTGHNVQQALMDYQNVTPPPAVKVNPSTVRWTNAPIGLASAAVVAPISMISDRSLTPEPQSMVADARSMTPESHYMSCDERSGTPDVYSSAKNGATVISPAAQRGMDAQIGSHIVENKSITPQMDSVAIQNGLNTPGQTATFELRSIAPAIVGSAAAATAFTSPIHEPQQTSRLVEHRTITPQMDSVAYANQAVSHGEAASYEAFASHAFNLEGHSAVVQNHTIAPQVGAAAYTNYSTESDHGNLPAERSLSSTAGAQGLSSGVDGTRDLPAVFETRVITPETNSIATHGESRALNFIEGAFNSHSSAADSATVRWTNAGVAGSAIGTSTVSPVSIEISSHENEGKANAISAERDIGKFEPGSIRWTSTNPDSALGTFNISASHLSISNEATDSNADRQSSSVMGATPANVRWTNYTTNSALGVATIGPATNSIYSDISFFDASNKDALGPVSQSISEGFASDPDFARWTTASPTAEEPDATIRAGTTETATTATLPIKSTMASSPTTPAIGSALTGIAPASSAMSAASVVTAATPVSAAPDLGKGPVGRARQRTSGGLRSYQSSLNLSSVAWPEELDNHLNDNYDTASITTKITDGNHSNYALSSLLAKPSFEKDRLTTDENEFGSSAQETTADKRSDTFVGVYNVPKNKEEEARGSSPFDSHMFESNSTRTSARWSQSIPLPSIQTDFSRPFGLTPPHEATLTSPESPSVRYKMAQVPSPIETGHVPVLLEPSAADTVNLSNTDTEAFGNDEARKTMRLSTSPSIGLGPLEGRASSKRMVEDYFSTREPIVATKADPVQDKADKAEKSVKRCSDFRAAMEAAARNNADDLPSTEDHPHLYYAKFDFNAREHGELGFDKGDPIVVVDSSDDIWWMGYKDNGNGEPMQGVFPSNYVERAPAAE